MLTLNKVCCTGKDACATNYNGQCKRKYVKMKKLKMVEQASSLLSGFRHDAIWKRYFYAHTEQGMLHRQGCLCHQLQWAW